MRIPPNGRHTRRGVQRSALRSISDRPSGNRPDRRSLSGSIPWKR
jgi:hypothetical protein